LKWRGTPYDVILNKCTKVALWKEEHKDVGETFLSWLLDHDAKTLVEEGMDIMEGLEGMWTGRGNVEMLKDTIDIITSVVVIWKTLSGCLDVQGVEERSLPEEERRARTSGSTDNLMLQEEREGTASKHTRQLTEQSTGAETGMDNPSIGGESKPKLGKDSNLEPDNIEELCINVSGGQKVFTNIQSNSKSYKKSSNATKKSNNTQNQIKNNKTNKITQIQSNKIIGCPEGKGKKNSWTKSTPSSVPFGPDDQYIDIDLDISNHEEQPSCQEDLAYDLMYGNSTSAMKESGRNRSETEEQNARGIVKPNTGTTSEERVKPNTGTPSDFTKPKTGVSPSPDDNSEATSQEEHSSSQTEDPTWERLSRADNMRKVRKERSRLENERRVATKRNNIFETTPEMNFTQGPSTSARRAPTTMGGRRILRSAEVSNRLVQDRSTPMNIIGSDVEALYPSLEAVQVADIV
jgi:hypothetical protein